MYKAARAIADYVLVKCAASESKTWTDRLKSLKPKTLKGKAALGLLAGAGLGGIGYAAYKQHQKDWKKTEPKLKILQAQMAESKRLHDKHQRQMAAYDCKTY